MQAAAKIVLRPGADSHTRVLVVTQRRVRVSFSFDGGHLDRPFEYRRVGPVDEFHLRSRQQVARIIRAEHKLANKSVLGLREHAGMKLIQTVCYLLEVLLVAIQECLQGGDDLHGDLAPGRV
jgi:hypothetical protein